MHISVLLVWGDWGRNVRWPHRMLSPGVSRWVCRRDRQTDGRTPDRCITPSTRRGQRNNEHNVKCTNQMLRLQLILQTQSSKHHRSAYLPGMFAPFKFFQRAGNTRIERAFALCVYLTPRCREESSKHYLRK